MSDQHQPRPKYLWPRFVLAAFILGVCLAVLAIRKEANRIKRIKNSTQTVQTNALPPHPGGQTNR